METSILVTFDFFPHKIYTNRLNREAAKKNIFLMESGMRLHQKPSVLPDQGRIINGSRHRLFPIGMGYDPIRFPWIGSYTPSFAVLASLRFKRFFPLKGISCLDGIFTEHFDGVERVGVKVFAH